MPEDIIRVIRVLEYTGPRSDVERTLQNSAVKGVVVMGTLIIREAIVGSFPEIMTPQDDLTTDKETR
jgi:hypothetical protein